MIKVGDQVTVYDAASYPLPVRGTVTKTTKTTCDVRTADGSMWSGFKKQCRRLKKKPRPPKEERVEFYANKWKIQPICDVQAYPSRARCCAEERIAFNSAVLLVELREKETILDRTALLDLIGDTLNEDPGLLVGTIEKWKELLTRLRKEVR